MMRVMLRRVFRFLFSSLAQLQVDGMEHIPAQGAAILAANHVSLLDSALVFSFIERDDLTGLVADTYQRRPFIRWVVNTVDGIWINREGTDFRALRDALECLAKGRLLGIAPEGTRSKTHAMALAKTGVAYLAERAQAPIVPVAVWGSETTRQHWVRLRRPTIHLRFGSAFYLPSTSRQDRTAGLERNTAEIMCRIAVMLPPAYRGFYADHPRLRELLNESPNPGLDEGVGLGIMQ